MATIEDAERLINQKTGNFTEAIAIYKKIAIDPRVPISMKINTILSMTKHIPDEAIDMLTRFRDMIPYVSNQAYTDLIILLTELAKNSSINDHERSVIAVTLYNRAEFVCFDCFISIAIDRLVSVNYRVEACRFLYASETDENQEIAQECLIEIIEDLQLSSDYRYNIITSFVSKAGVTSYLNAKKIKVAYNEPFVYSLQMIFFHDSRNGVRERILSGQHLLQMTATTEDEKSVIMDDLLKIAENKEYSDNTRADAADVLLRKGSKEISHKARTIITNLGFSAIGLSNANVIERVKTVYNNSQNIHDEVISSTIDRFIEKIGKEDSRPIPFDDVKTAIIKYMKANYTDRAMYFKVYRAINRVSIDTAQFSSAGLTLAEILVHVWMRIQNQPNDIIGMLTNRLIEELLDMEDTCSSGHSGRFVNVLSSVDPDLDIRISFKSQIEANVAGRINARIRDITDPELKESVAMGMMPTATEGDVIVYKTFIDSTIDELHKELADEFVTNGGYLNHRVFEEYFSLAVGEWRR